MQGLSGRRSRAALVFVFLSVLAALACSGKSERGGGADNGGTGGAQGGLGGSTGGGASTAHAGSGGTAGVGAGGAAADLQQFYRALYEASCDFEERCAGVNGRAFVNRDYCLEDLENLLQFATPTISSYVVELAYGAACIASRYPADSCDAPSPTTNTPACKQALVLAGAVGEGGVCFSGATDYKSCDYDLDCEVSGGCGYCVPAPARQPNGSPCTDGDECESDSCGPNQTCVPRSGRGEPCSLTVACRGNLSCRNSPDGSTCQDRPGVGDSCADNRYSCLGGLTCSEDGDICVPEARLGAPCDRTEMSCAAVCNFETPDARTGTCTPTYATLGEPCSYTNGAHCFDAVAEETLDPDGTPIACVCSPAPSLPVGSPCSSAADCEYFVCESADPGDPSAPGACREKLHAGEACLYHATCESGYCAEIGLCEDAPVCE